METDRNCLSENELCAMVSLYLDRPNLSLYLTITRELAARLPLLMKLKREQLSEVET